MKSLLVAIILTLAITSSALANKKEVPVYDQTAVISFSGTSHDTEGHYTGADGRTSDVYCDSSTSSCTSSAGAFVVTFKSGNRTSISNADPLVSRCEILRCQPLLNLIVADGKPHEFHYRKVTKKDATGWQASFMCVYFESADNHGKLLGREACYQIYSLLTPDNDLLFPDHKTGVFAPLPAEASKYRMK